VIGRLLATFGILALLALDLALPSTDIGRRGTSGARDDVPAAAAKLGERMPDFSLVDLDGRVIRRSDLLGQRVLLTFERSVDW
jgi:cytochrome oxidase Cu insertion factor (SCO1/SenC/PrrC family)